MYQEALKEYRRAIELDPQYFEAYYNLAFLYQEMKSPKTTRAWEKYIELASKAPSEAPFVRAAEENLKKSKEVTY